MGKLSLKKILSILASTVILSTGLFVGEAPHQAYADTLHSNTELCDQAQQADDAPASFVKDIDYASKCRVSGVHTDAFATYLDSTGKLVLATRADEIDSQSRNGLRYDSNRLIFELDDRAKTTVPGLAGDAYDFLRRATVNNEFWQIPLSQQQGILWAGFSTEALFSKANGQVKMTMVDMKGPQDGAIYMWTFDIFKKVHPKMASPNVAVPGATADADQWSVDHQLSIPQHEHVQWAFTRSGTYTITMKATVNIGGQEMSATQDYTFEVGLHKNGKTETETGPDTGNTVTPSNPSQPQPGTVPSQPASQPQTESQIDPHTQVKTCLTLADLKNQGRNVMVIDHGHVDIAAYTPVGGGLSMAVQEDLTGLHVRRDTGGVVFWVHGGQASNGSGYTIPQTSIAGVPWLGWNNQSMKPRLPVSMTLVRVQGPGSVRVWLQGDLGQPNQTVVSTAGPYSYTMIRNTHTHANWDFSAPGYYTITLAYSALSGTVTRDIHFAVGQVDPWQKPVACTPQAIESAGRGVAAGAVSAASARGRGSLPGLNSQLDGDAIDKKSEKNASKDVYADDDKSAESGESTKHSHSGVTDTATMAASGELYAQDGIGGVFIRYPILAWLIITLTCIVLCVAVTLTVLIAREKRHALHA